MEERPYWLAWSLIPGIGPVVLKRLQQRFGTLSSAWSADSGTLGAVTGIGAQTLKTIQKHRQSTNPTDLLAQHIQKNPSFWCMADQAYPRMLTEIADSPPLLYYRGQVQLSENQGSTPMVGIVGTRDPSEYAKRWTRKIAYALAKRGITVVSGMAEGIDTQAHLGCIEGGGRTIAVLGTGVDMIYPPRNQGLYQKIEQQGLLLSEYPSGTQPNRAHFPRRNRIVAGLCRALLVMEAPTKSGALITAYQANEYNRDIYVLPGSLDNPRAMGCLGLVQRGAQLILGIGQLLDQLGAMPPLSSAPAPSISEIPSTLPSVQAEILKTVSQLCQQSGDGSVPFDLIVQSVELSAGEVSGEILQLELQGLVNQLPGMRYAPNS
ncbi:DNA-processing protein DprA [Acaryochloris marina]|uniref:DNA protecting protein DprA n=1 Tax=Acaryochloris marina (strain MBIC 11017) TaxID=329726 RepID=B0C0E4_ACAM1|nr:DNA-processing protein DprA [Acaryochloris marina]ABW29636.1 DNA protecting protein DprA [Acaryochloris marina MBIC11017]BDM78538.1 DNA processing protein DprA [Acaryochloris marina MBIC10699]